MQKLSPTQNASAAGGTGRSRSTRAPSKTKSATRLAAGEGLATICKDPNMPSEQAVRQWVMDDRPPGIALRYARARTIGYHHLADEIIQLSDDLSLRPPRHRERYGGAASAGR